MNTTYLVAELKEVGESFIETKGYWLPYYLWLRKSHKARGATYPRDDFVDIFQPKVGSKDSINWNLTALAFLIAMIEAGDV
jgi:hypothetical protein